MDLPLKNIGQVVYTELVTPATRITMNIVSSSL